MVAGEKVTVFGIGRLGICLALVLEKAGYDVLGVDVFPGYVDSLNKKTFVSKEPRVTELLLASTKFRATTSLEEGLKHSDKIFLMVATPSTGGEKAYDHSAVNNLLFQFNAAKVQNKHFIIGCTVIPGYIAHVGRYLIRDTVNCTLSYNPEFIAQGDVVKGLLQPDMVLIGEGSPEIGQWLEDCYTAHTTNKPAIHRMSAESAEICKLSVNCYVTMKISYANQIGDIADRTPGADKFAILRAVGADSRVGSKCILPGYGFGGPCFPRDNRALGGYAERVGITPMLMKATDEYNKFHAKVMADNLIKENKDLYVFEDVAYKPKCPVNIIEESQPLAVAYQLVKQGKKVLIRDRNFIVAEVQKDFGDAFDYEIVESL
eukprot:ANDGO_00460.mRNA.1 UDP-glucose 6-dehydrogenase AglM